MSGTGSPLWHRKDRRRRSAARTRAQGDLEACSSELLIQDFQRLESHHGSQPTQRLCTELERRQCMPRWTCGGCSYSHHHREKGCAGCHLGKQEATGAKCGKKGKWEPVAPKAVEPNSTAPLADAAKRPWDKVAVKVEPHQEDVKPQARPQAKPSRRSIVTTAPRSPPCLPVRLQRRNRQRRSSCHRRTKPNETSIPRRFRGSSPR